MYWINLSFCFFFFQLLSCYSLLLFSSIVPSVSTNWKLLFFFFCCIIFLSLQDRLSFLWYASPHTFPNLRLARRTKYKWNCREREVCINKKKRRLFRHFVLLTTTKKKNIRRHLRKGKRTTSFFFFFVQRLLSLGCSPYCPRTKIHESRSIAYREETTTTRKKKKTLWDVKVRATSKTIVFFFSEEKRELLFTAFELAEACGVFSFSFFNSDWFPLLLWFWCVFFVFFFSSSLLLLGSFINSLPTFFLDYCHACLMSCIFTFIFPFWLLFYCRRSTCRSLELPFFFSVLHAASRSLVAPCSPPIILVLPPPFSLVILPFFFFHYWSVGMSGRTERRREGGGKNKTRYGTRDCKRRQAIGLSARFSFFFFSSSHGWGCTLQAIVKVVSTSTTKRKKSTYVHTEGKAERRGKKKTAAKRAIYHKLEKVAEL